MRFPILASASRHLQASYAVATSASIGGRYGSFLASTAQAMRASLLAKATAATLRWVRAVSWASHELRPEDCFALCCRTARAPCTKSLRK
jgi:hypothetical protein